ncbi:MAG: RNA-binding transcriptional accessory protein [Planctomycetes bacterium]|nr:RNA-binding transcriptional accessory protein [Planctomycetota bacterium]
MSEVPLDLVVAAVAAETALPPEVVRAVLDLTDEGATVPFIARYRKERTRALDELGIRAIVESRDRVLKLEARRFTIRSQLEEQGVLTAALEQRLQACTTSQELEDFYLPYKPKRRSKATEALERGLEALAVRILEQPRSGVPLTEAQRFVNPAKGVDSAAAALEGAGDIVIDRIACDPDLRRALRSAYLQYAEVQATRSKTAPDERTPFDDYGDHQEPLRSIPSHRFLALRRGAEVGVLDLKLVFDRSRTLAFIERHVHLEPRSPYADLLVTAVKDAWTNRLKRALETEVMAELKSRADADAARVFADNLGHLLLAAPRGTRPVIGIDPGFRSGCKCAAIDGAGRFLGTITIYPHQGAGGQVQAAEQLIRFLTAHPSFAIAIGNGTAGRETESFVRTTIANSPHRDLIVVSVSESGASIYSASDLAREEFPDLDLTIRGAISIARRLQDPLAELVKVDPRSIGVGQYQHDVDQSLLEKKLGDVVETCVNRVGVELNTASASLLAHVAGIGTTLAKRIVAQREAKGAFPTRAALATVKGIGKRTFEQAAGFLRVSQSDEPLDRSAVHPERYDLVRRMARDLKTEVAALVGAGELAQQIEVDRYVDDDIGEPTLRDIIDELVRPGRDPRESFEPPRFRDDVNAIGDLEPGMEFEGIVTNVTAFGAFVDIGVHQDGLVHKSAFWRRVHEPSELVHVGDRLLVTVEEIDSERGRIALRAHRR